jgi:hypothetical protein
MTRFANIIRWETEGPILVVGYGEFHLIGARQLILVGGTFPLGTGAITEPPLLSGDTAV